MKKISYISLLLSVVFLLCGCVNSNKNANVQENTESVSDDLMKDDVVDDGTEEMREAASLCFEACISDEEFINKIEEFILKENQFINMMETEWPAEGAEEMEYKGIPYLLVGEFSWTEYEKKAREFYSQNYVENVFTPRYTTESNLFIEIDGKLYREMADGIAKGVKKDSVNAWGIADGLYYVTVLEETEELITYVFIMEEEPDATYGFQILNKYFLSK